MKEGHDFLKYSFAKHFVKSSGSSRNSNYNLLGYNLKKLRSWLYIEDLTMLCIQLDL